ncbi:MAG: hypothetical protein BYD32DRAFT_437926 [Podila humilis]|nr:MAG: hypothetical protein BYD32DRAFT_437926 [Podila humilis]
MSDFTSTTTTSTSSTSLTETITSTLVSSITATISATLSAATPTPTSNLDWPQPPSDGYLDDTDPTKLLCEWPREAIHCRDSEFTKWMLVASSVAHFIVALYGIWLLQYRNRGFNSKIVTDLYTKVGTGLRPKPMDCIIFFTSLACFIKVAANLPLVFGKLENMMWLRVAIEQLYWVFVAIAFSSYFVGLLYAMPVTTREGIFAVYQPEVVYGARPLPAIHVLTPTTVQKNVMLAIGAIYPTVFGAGLGIASGVLHDHGMKEASRVLMLLQYSNWVLILWSMAVMFFYYGLKYTFILRANIIIAEAALKAPRAAFGIGNLKSRSPARFLFIQLQITGFGGCAVTVLAGTLCMIWVLFRDQILAMESDILPHVMAVLWTCAIALAFFVVFTLIAAQSIRNRRRGLHEPSTTLSHSYVPGDSSAQKSSGKVQRSGQDGISGFDPEARLTQHSSGELSTLRSVDSVEKSSLERLDRYGDSIPYDEVAERAAVAASVAAMSELSDIADQEQNRNSWRPTSPTNRALTIQIGDNNNSSTPANHSNIRESVFGGRTAREEPGPTSPTSGFSLPSFPLVSMRSGSRNSTQPRPSTSSATHTTSTTSSRLSHGSSNTMPASPTSPTSPTHASMQSLQMQTQQQLQQLATQQQTQKTSGQRGAKGGFQAIPENQYISSEDRGGDLLYSDTLQYRQQQHPYRTKPSHPSMDSDVQLQQQHPLHQVAFKGLSPPPRSTVSSTLPMTSPPTSPVSSSPGGRNKGMSPKPSPMMGPVISPSVQLSSPPSPAMMSQHRTRTANEAMHAQQAFPVGYEDPYQVPRVGGAVRRSSNQNKEQSIVSSPVMVPASRGPGGGYQSQGQPAPQQMSLRQKSYPNAQPQAQPHPQAQQPQPRYEHVGYYGQQEEFDDGASIESAEEWPMPPTFK